MSGEALDENFYQELFESVIERSSDLIYFKNTDHELVYLGETYANIFEADREELLGKTAHELWPVEAEEIIADEELVLQGQPIIDRERKVTHPDGSEHWYLIHKVPRRDDQGAIVGFFAIDREITDRKRHERELVRFRSFVEHTTDVVVLIGRNGTIEYVSPAIESMLGFERHTVHRRDPLQHIHPSDRDEVEAIVGQLAVEPADLGTFEFRVKNADGQWRWIEANGVHRPHVDGIEGVLLVTRDVTDRKHRERQARRLERAVDASGHAIYVTDTDGTIEYVNPAFEEITGYQGDEALGKSPRILNSGVHSEDYYERLWNTILSGEVWDETVINKRKDGSTYHAHQTIAPITVDGAIKSFVAIQTDITDRVELEERLSVLNRILRHDIRSAVGVIRGNADLAASAPDQRETALKTVRETAAQLYRLGENARHVERVLQDQPTETDRFDLQALISARAIAVEEEYQSASIHHDLKEDCYVEVSPYFPEALGEIIENAIVHNDSDVPEVTVRVDPGADGEWVDLAIADNGPGIPEDELDPIRRGAESALEHASGLGLWVVHWIVEESGGQLRFETPESGGTTVRIRLPLAAP